VADARLSGPVVFMQLNALVLSFLASAAVSGAVTIVAWRRRHLVGARELALLMVAITWWLAANALEAASIDRSAKIAWSVAAYPGIQAVAVLYLLFILGWTRQDGALTVARVALLFVIPGLSVAMAATNEWHHLLWPQVTLIDAWGATAVYQRGPWFWIEVAYAYALIAASLIALLVACYRYPAVRAARLRLVIVGSLVPVAGSLLYAAGLDARVHADLSSIAFAVAGIIGAWAVLRLRLLDIVPVAWPALVDALGDAVLVLDPELRIAALNRSATRLIGGGRAAVGQPIDTMLRGFPELLALCRLPGNRQAEIPVGPGPARPPDPASPPAPGDPASLADVADVADGGPSGPGPSVRWFNVRTTAVRDERLRDAGLIVVLRDVTERRQMVETIRTLSLTDELTGLLNRRGFITLAEHELRTSRRTGARLWLLFADLDGLKEINDLHGHEAGDRALVEIAELLRAGSFRQSDLVARLGGDEFAILAAETSRTDGGTLARRIDDAVHRADTSSGRDFALSLSIGTAVYDPERPQTLDSLIGEADRRMYEVKHARSLDRRALAAPGRSAPEPQPASRG
jgi:diguanylate cyclase (GGDEF)-like protein